MVLNGWKEISVHLHCGVRSAQRWQGEGLPIRRVTSGPRSHVFAYSEQLDSWLNDGNLRQVHNTARIPVHLRSRELVAQMRESRQTLHQNMTNLRGAMDMLRDRQREIAATPALFSPSDKTRNILDRHAPRRKP